MESPTPSPHIPRNPTSAPFPLSAGTLPMLQGLRAVLVGSWRVRGDGNHPIGLLGLESLAF